MFQCYDGVLNSRHIMCLRYFPLWCRFIENKNLWIKFYISLMDVRWLVYPEGQGPSCWAVWLIQQYSCQCPYVGNHRDRWAGRKLCWWWWWHLYIFFVSAWCFILVLRFPPTFQRHFGQEHRELQITPRSECVWLSCIFLPSLCV